MDAYKAWLEEQIAYWTQRCLESAAGRGYTGKLRFADQTLREILDTYQECLDKYNELAAQVSPALSNDQLLELGKLRPGEKSISETIEEDRGEL